MPPLTPGPAQVELKDKVVCLLQQQLTDMCGDSNRTPRVSILDNPIAAPLEVSDSAGGAAVEAGGACGDGADTGLLLAGTAQKLLLAVASPVAVWQEDREQGGEEGESDEEGESEAEQGGEEGPYEGSGSGGSAYHFAPSGPAVNLGEVLERATLEAELDVGGRDEGKVGGRSEGKGEQLLGSCPHPASLPAEQQQLQQEQWASSWGGSSHQSAPEQQQEQHSCCSSSSSTGATAGAAAAASSGSQEEGLGAGGGAQAPQSAPSAPAGDATAPSTQADTATSPSTPADATQPHHHVSREDLSVKASSSSSSSTPADDAAASHLPVSSTEGKAALLCGAMAARGAVYKEPATANSTAGKGVDSRPVSDPSQIRDQDSEVDPVASSKPAVQADGEPGGVDTVAPCGPSLPCSEEAAAEGSQQQQQDGASAARPTSPRPVLMMQRLLSMDSVSGDQMAAGAAAAAGAPGPALLRANRSVSSGGAVAAGAGAGGATALQRKIQMFNAAQAGREGGGGSGADRPASVAVKAEGAVTVQNQMCKPAARVGTNAKIASLRAAFDK